MRGCFCQAAAPSPQAVRGKEPERGTAEHTRPSSHRPRASAQPEETQPAPHRELCGSRDCHGHQTGIAGLAPGAEREGAGCGRESHRGDLGGD